MPASRTAPPSPRNDSLQDYEVQVGRIVAECVYDRFNLRTWDEVKSHLTSLGHRTEDLAQRREYILDRLLCHWAESVKKDKAKLKIDHSRPQCYGALEVAAALYGDEALISDSLVGEQGWEYAKSGDSDSSGLTFNIHDDKIVLDCEPVENYQQGIRHRKISFTVVYRLDPRLRDARLVIPGNKRWNLRKRSVWKDK